MSVSRRHASLVQHHLQGLLALFLALTLMNVAAVLAFVLLPLAERSADDLAGLLVLSAQTWSELPPDTRADFEIELLRKHQLALQTDRPVPTDNSPLRHGFYVHYLEQALRQRSGPAAELALGTGPTPGDWLWTHVQAGGQDIGVGFSVERLHTRPLWGLAVLLLGGTAMASLAALWLARRIARPVAQLERAAAQLASGASPAMLPRAGPRELADLAGHFNRMASQVRELLDARTTLLAGISHDLRTPLARMRLALELFTLQPSPALQARLEQDIDEMNGLIGQLLDVARGLAHEEPRHVALQPWLQARADRHAEAARAAGATLTVTCPPSLHVLAPVGLLGRAVDNLLANALRYAPGPIDLAAQAVDRPSSSRIRLAVLDRGPGIPPHRLEAVWRPFQRVEESRNPQTGGYGLGLAIVRQLAVSQGWSVGLEARDGGGLVAWLELPAP